jgi:hypothetical protein
MAISARSRKPKMVPKNGIKAKWHDTVSIRYCWHTSSALEWILESPAQNAHRVRI